MQQIKWIVKLAGEVIMFYSVLSIDLWELCRHRICLLVVTYLQFQTNWLKEMSAGLADSDSEDESESDENDEESDADEGSDEGSDEESDEDRISVNPPVRREDKKTEKQRKKEQQQKEKVHTTFNGKKTMSWLTLKVHVHFLRLEVFTGGWEVILVSLSSY